MKYLFFIGIALSLISCGNLQHANFNKQKFTNLKSQHQNDEHAVESKEEKFNEPDSKSDIIENSLDDLPKTESNENSEESTTQTDSDNNFYVNSLSNYVLLDEEYTDTTEKILLRALVLKYNFLIEIDSQWFRIDSAIFVETTHSIEGNLIPVKNMKEYNHERTIKLETNAYINPNTKFVTLHKDQIITLKSNPRIESEKIPDEKYLGYDPNLTVEKDAEDEQIQDAKTKFNLYFKIGLMLALMSVLLYSMAWFSTSIAMFAFSLAGAHLSILIVWILSFLLINLAKKIPKNERDQKFKSKHALAWFTAIIGPFVGIGVIILGIIIAINNFF